MKYIVKLIGLLNQWLRYFIAMCLFVMTSVIAFQVFVRIFAKYLDFPLPSWTEELARYLMIWLVFIGASLAVRYSSLIGVEVMPQSLSSKNRKIVKIVVNLVSMIFYLILIIVGFKFIYHVSSQLSPSMRIPMWIPYSAIPVGGIFMLINSVAVLYGLIKSSDLEPQEEFRGSE